MKLTIFLFMSLAFSSLLEQTTPLEAKMLLDSNKAIIVDVREPQETSSGIVPGALLLPMSVMDKHPDTFKKIVSDFSKNKTVIVYCASGRRSQIVGSEIQTLGYRVLNMKSFTLWKEAGFDIKK